MKCPRCGFPIWHFYEGDICSNGECNWTPVDPKFDRIKEKYYYKIEKNKYTGMWQLAKMAYFSPFIGAQKEWLPLKLEYQAHTFEIMLQFVNDLF